MTFLSEITSDTLLENFALLDDWEDRYKYILELGRALPSLPESDRTDRNKVQGCTSHVWLIVNLIDHNGHSYLDLKMDSDALMVRGLLAIIFILLQKKPIHTIKTSDALTFFQKIDLKTHLSSQRSNGIYSVLKKIETITQELMPSSLRRG